MKKKAIRITKSAFSLALALCMLFSCVIQSGAAQVQSESTGWNTNSLTFHGQIKSDKSGYDSSWNDITMSGNGTNYYYFWAIVKKNKTVSFDLVDQWNQYLKGGTKTANSTNSTTGISRCYWSGLSTSGSDPSFTTPNSTYSKYIVVIQCWTDSWNVRADMIPYTESTVKVHYQDQYGSYHKYLYAWQTYHGGSSYNATNALTNYTNSVGNRDLTAAYDSVTADTRAAEGVTGYTNDWNTHDLSYYDYPSNYGEFYLIMKDGSGQSKDLTINRTDVSGKSEIWVYNASNDDSVIIVTDRVALRTKINDSSIVSAYNSGTNSGYTSSTYETFKTAYQDAASKFSAYDTTQAQIDAAVTALQDAYDALERAATPLTTPTISFANGTVTAGPSNSATLTVSNHSTIRGQDSGVTYELYKDGTKVTQSANTYTYSNGVFTIPARYSNRATTTGYTVKAIASNSSYSDSAVSSASKLTINKQTVDKPTISIDKTDIASGSTATITVTNASNYASDKYTLKLYKSTTAQSNTFTNGGTTVNAAGTYKVKAVSRNSEYYADSNYSDTVSLTVNTPAWFLIGGINGDDWSTESDTYKLTSYNGNNVFYYTYNATGVTYFGLSTGGNRYQPKDATYENPYDVTDCQTSETAKELEQKSEASFKIPNAGTYIIYIDQTTQKVWVTQNTWAITPHVYYQSYNLTNDSYNTAQEGTTGGTISPEDETILVNKNSSVTLTASPKSGYTFAGWYSSSSFTGTALSTATSYTYTPTSSGEVYALFKENIPTHYTISVATVANAEVRATYNGTTHQEGSSFSAPKGASIVLYCVADTGYQAVLSPSVVAPNYSFTVSANTTVTATVTKINYALTGVVSPSAANSATGTIKFYSNSGCTTEITTATYQQTFYAKYTPPSEYYELSSFTISGTGSSKTGTSGNIGTFKMGYANATVTANVVAATPTFGTCPNMEVYAGESFTYNGATLATLPNSTLTYSFNGSAYQSSKTFTAPATAGTCTLVIKATNKPTGISTAVTATKDVTITVKYREKNVTYYVDMHNNDMTGKTVEVAIVNDNTSSATVLPDSNNPNQNCQETLTKQGSSTVYAATIATPVTKSGTMYSNVYLRVKYGTDTKYLTIAGNEVKTYIMSDSVTNPEVWIEARNEAGNTYKVTYATNSTNISVASGNKRIYVAKPYDWQTDEPDWENLRLYHWGDYDDIGWSTTPQMNYIGHDSNYHYYCVDVASDVNNIIFQGWKNNSNTPNVQTGNIENIGSSNYFVLSKDGNAYSATKGDNATVPGYTRYVDSVAMNVGNTANIAPTHTGAKVTYTASDTSKVTISNTGVLTANASTFGGSDVTVTVKVYGTVGAKVANAADDYLKYTFSVSIRNPGVFNGYNIMSFEHQEYTVTIPEVSNTQPGYFVLDDTSVTVNGLYDGSAYTASYANSAIIKSTATVNVSGVGAMPTSFTVKYAASNSSKGYTNITLNDATVVTKSIRITEGQRYGFSEWDPAQDSVSQSKIINNGVETVTHKGFAFTSGTSTYQAIFAPYTYVDVTFNFVYDEYVPEVVTVTENGVSRTITNYQYDSTWAAQDNAHETKTCKVSDFEVRGYTSSTVTSDVLKTEARKAIEVLPESNYYNYSIDAENITKTENGAYKANVTVNLTKSLRKYKVYLNGNLKSSDYTYQAYADLNTGSTVSKWYAVNSSTATDTSTSPLLATGTGYKFRVKGDTYLRTVDGTIADDAFNRSENGFSHYEVTHKGDTAETMKEYLLQNFYIADFFDKDKVKDLTRDDTPKADEANFVGGGVVYYSMNGVTESSSGTPYSKAVDAGYVNSNGTINANEVKAMLKRNIEANYSNYASLAAAIGEEDAMKVVYGQKIDVTNHTENGTKTGVLYRYLPLENYSVDANNNISTTLNSDVFRYSNSLQSYQYVYASGNENKATNNGKNMRLYSYFIYSYLSYDKDTNLPQTKYEVVLSDQYSDASTYWDGN